ncbi:META domain-containing protein [Cyclobacterium lianum]|uniref:META domain-containing protein n=1 Tax=Cyclobacterium lianum TaxID=388280 RepID=A0A1M7N4L0_9BACT|nr:META domain-containing protein [Cyclobacterium lianum]SHM98417.1 META domain-containing protein [Cyclobacterium lianum]
MNNKTALVTLTFLILSGACIEGENAGCPVPYYIQPGNHEIYNTWAFVGFRHKTLRWIDYPPCELYINDEGKVTPGRIRITFTEEASRNEELPDYQIFSGAGPVNGFSGDFQLSGNTIQSGGRIVTTFIASIHANVNDYESKLYGALMQMTHFNIDKNQLLITFGEGEKEMLWVLSGGQH